MLDASALVKRYVVESGSDTMNRLFDSVDARRMSCLMLGAAEVASVLIRKRNAGRISSKAFAAAQDALLREVILATEFATLPASNEDVLAALAFLDQHSLSATDAVLLRVTLDIQDGAVAEDRIVVVASDGRLLRAARAEGLDVIDAEGITPEALDTLLASP